MRNISQTIFKYRQNGKNYQNPPRTQIDNRC